MNATKRSYLYLDSANRVAGAMYDPNSAETLPLTKSFFGEELQNIADWGRNPDEDKKLKQQFFLKIRNILGQFEGAVFLVKSSGQPAVISRIQRHKGPFSYSATIKRTAIFSKDACVQGNLSVSVAAALLSPETFSDGINEAFDYFCSRIILTRDPLDPIELASMTSLSVECKHGNIVEYVLLEQLAHINAISLSINRSQDNILRIFSSTNDTETVSRIITSAC